MNRKQTQDTGAADHAGVGSTVIKKPYVKPAATAVGKCAPDQSRRRSQRVVLRISLLIRATIRNGGNVQAHGFTVVVNAHGGLLEASLKVLANDEITLVHPQTGEEALCRVVRTELAPSGVSTIAFEFREPTAQFWPISFPPTDWTEFTS
jgi:hypothetical protein